MVDASAITRRGHPVLFGILLVFGIIEGAVTAWLVNQYDYYGYPNSSIRDRVRFLVFTAWWTVVFSAGYIAVFFTAPGSFLASIASHGVWVFITWVFWLSGAAALTAALGGGLSCGLTNLAYCSQLNASIAFAWIEFIVITILLALIAFVGTSAMRRGDKLSAGLV